MEVMTSSPVQECSLMEIDNDADTGIGMSATVDKKLSYIGKEHTKVASGEMGSIMRADINGEVEVRKKMEAMNGEKSLGTNGIDYTALKMRKRETMEDDNPDSGDILSTCERTKEGLSMGNETVSGNGKTGESETADLNVNGSEKRKKRRKSKNKRPTLGEILSPQYLQSLEAANGEAGLGTVSTDNAASKKETMQKVNKSPELDDILGTHVSTREGLSTTKVLEVKSGETVSGKTATPDADVVSKGDHIEVASGKMGEGETTDLNASGKNKMQKKLKSKNKEPTLAEILNPQYLQNLEASKGEKGSGTTSTDNPASQKQKRQKLNKNSDLADCESAHEGLSTTNVFEVQGGETVSAKTAAPDAEVANGKTGDSETTDLNVNGKGKKKRKAKSKNEQPTLGDILNPQYLQNLEAARGEMDSGTTSTGNSASQQRKREKTMNNNPDLGDILSTRESTQEGLSRTKVFEVKSGKTVLAKTATIDANIVSNGDHAAVSIGKTGESETTNLNVNGKEKKKKKKKKKPKSNNRPPTSAELNPQYLQNLEAAESTQEGLSTTKVLEVKSGEMVSGKTATSDANMVPKGDHTEVVNSKMEENETNNHNVNGKEKKKKKKKKKPKSKNKGTTLGENLNPQYLQNLEAARHETGSKSTDLKNIDCPQVANSEMGKKLIILDVNGLLADILTERPKGFVADKYLPRRTIFKRPYLDDFLCFCFERFKVGIWSSRLMKNLVPVIDFLFGGLKKKLLFMWDSCKCTNSGIGTLEVKHKNVVVKDLRKIWDENGPKKSWVKGMFHESNTLLVDDSPYKALLNPKHTGIFPASYSYKNCRKDKFLAPKGELQTYLEGWAAADDVKSYVEQHPFGQGAIDEQSPHWAFYSSIIERLNDENIMESLSKKNQKKRKRCFRDIYHAY